MQLTFKISLFVFYTFTVLSCLSEKETRLNQAYNHVISQSLTHSCGLNKLNDPTTTSYVTVFNKLKSFSPINENIEFNNFNFSDFENLAIDLEFSLSEYPKIHKIKVLITQTDSLRKMIKMPYIESIQFKHRAIYGDNYCNVVIFSKPKVIMNNGAISKVLIQSQTIMEYPIDISYYLIEYDHNGIMSSQKLDYREKIMKLY